MDLAVGVNALEVVHQGSAAQTRDPTIRHGAPAVRTGGSDVWLAVRGGGNVSLDLQTAAERVVQVAGTVANVVLLHVPSIMTHRPIFGVDNDA
jgi:hypothetical protein